MPSGNYSLRITVLDDGSDADQTRVATRHLIDVVGVEFLFSGVSSRLAARLESPPSRTASRAGLRT